MTKFYAKIVYKCHSQFHHERSAGAPVNNIPKIVSRESDNAQLIISIPHFLAKQTEDGTTGVFTGAELGSSSASVMRNADLKKSTRSDTFLKEYIIWFNPPPLPAHAKTSTIHQYLGYNINII